MAAFPNDVLLADRHGSQPSRGDASIRQVLQRNE
jgi:hypothetical protein